MKYLIIIQLFILSVFSASIEFTQAEKNFINQNKNIKIGIESAKPYIFYNSQKNTIDGLYADFLKTIVDSSGLNVEFVQDDWSTLLADFKNKKLDILPATFYSKDREQFGRYSDPYYNVKEYIYMKSSHPGDFTNLNNKRIAVVEGYATINKLKKHFPAIQIIETKNLHESSKLVLEDKADALVDYHLVVENFIYDNTIIGLKGMSQNFLEEISVHYLSHIDKPLLHSIIQKSLLNITQKEKEKIFRNWFSDMYIETSNHILSLQEKQFVEKQKKIRVRVRPDRPPFEFVENGQAKGLAVDYFLKSAKNIGLDVEFVINNMPIKDAYQMVETSQEKFDTLLFTVKNKEREKRFSFGEAYLSYPMMIVTHKNTSYINSIKDLMNKTVVIEKGFLTNKWIKRDYPSINIINAFNTKEALKMVNDKKAYAYVGNLGITNYMINFEGLNNLKIAAPSSYGEINYSFISPKKWPELSSLLSKGYNQISPSEHSSIQQKWFSVQKIDTTNYTLIGQIFAFLILVILIILWWNRNITLERNKTQMALEKLKSAQQELEAKTDEVEESRKFLQSVIDESPNPIIVKNYDGKFILVNQAVADLYKTDKESMLGKDDGDFIKDQEMAEFFRQNIRDIMDKQETKVVYEDSQDVNTGETRHYMSVKKPFKDLNGDQCILVIANDITEIKKLEEEKAKNSEILFKQSKMAAMGEMIGNIAHQWRQPLSVISTSSTGVIYLKEINQLTDEILINDMNLINNNAQYLSRTIDDFKNFIKGERTKVVFTLNDTIESFLNLIAGNIKHHHIQIIQNLEDGITSSGYPNELMQCLINIFNNAKDAFQQTQEEKNVFISTKKDNKHIIITIKDNAGGIPQDVLPHIFEPYYTTKHQSQGTGLGLSMTYNLIVDGMKGNIEVSNVTYEYNNMTQTGAEFKISLPY